MPNRSKMIPKGTDLQNLFSKLMLSKKTLYEIIYEMTNTNGVILEKIKVSNRRISNLRFRGAY